MEKRAMLAGGDHRSRDWTALPGDLLACIRGRLPPADFVRFAAICTAWRQSAPSTPAPQLPWLMLPPPSSSPGAAVICRFFSPAERKTYLVSAPELRGNRCVGSREGWVASFDRATAEMSMVNPLTRARLPLPSLPTIAPHEAQGIARKVVASSAPTDAACKLAATFDRFLPPAFVAVGGDEKWAAAPGGAGELMDVVHHDGDGGFYGVDFDNRVFRWHAAADAVDLSGFYYYTSPDFPRPSYRYKRYMAVHRPSGDLLLIFVDFVTVHIFRGAFRSRVRKTEAVKAFRRRGDVSSAGAAWLRLESLGGCSLFLGKNQPICLSAQDVPELRADCVFLIDHGLSAHDRRPQWTQLWVYDLKEGVLEPCWPSEWQDSDEVPLWFTPNLS